MEKDTSEIAKLSERISKDPKSKLFVPLAEEYKKIGELDTAILVLAEGLKNNPGYITARSFLGRLLLETGDLSGAQKELEEVIKTVPDNLLAQRKLGDIYVLQGKGQEAIARYRTALSLNPGDKEIGGLLGDLEAGKDVSGRIAKPKLKSPPQAAAASQPSAAPPPPKPAPAAVRPAVAPVTTKPAAPPEPKTAPAGPAAGRPAAAGPEPARTAVSPPQPQKDDAEVVEDIIELEPLEISPEESGSGGQAISEEAAPPFTQSDTSPASFDLSEPSPVPEEHHEEPAGIAWEPPTDAGAPEVKTAETIDESADDLNTNTLAELYISQGFYDKAIEVYEGMLNDQPENRALQQKLVELRSLSGAAPQGSDVSTPVVQTPREYRPPGAPVPEEPRPEPPQKKETAGQSTVMPAAPVAQNAPEETPSGRTEKAAAPLTAKARRKETIDRLETWLKNIMKEKGE